MNRSGSDMARRRIASRAIDKSPTRLRGKVVIAWMLIAAPMSVVTLMPVATAQSGGSAADSDWQPRPVALPPVAGQRPSAAAKTETFSPTIVIQMPAPPVAVAVEPVAPPPPEPVRHRRRSATPVATRKTSPPAMDPIATAARQSQLAESATDRLRSAHWSAQRGATHTARDAAQETLRTICSLRDSQIGDDRHRVWLDQAMTAIDESADFTGRFGEVNRAAIERFVLVHRTHVLRNVDVSGLTPPRAVEAYLADAQEKLVAAVGGGPVAAEAVMILADIEASADRLSNGGDVKPRQASLHAAELSLMYRRAAIQIDPTNARAAAALGNTLLQRSIPEAAVHYLTISVREEPTRQNVQSLRQAALMAGNVALARQCDAGLSDGRLHSDSPVPILSPAQFAATHQTFPAGQTLPITPSARVATGNRVSSSARAPSAAGSPAIPRSTDAGNSPVVDPSASSTRRGWFW